MAEVPWPQDDPYYITPEEEAALEERANKHLAELIKYAEEAKKEGFPFEVTGEDLDMTLRGLKSLRGEVVNPHVLPHAPEPQPDFERMARVLREHWLTGLECDHEAKTDVANCFCGRWRPAPEPSVGQAVERWIEHVIEHLKRS